MKNYREIADSVFARREQYMIAQRKKKQTITRAAVSVGSVALVSLAGFALWGNDAFHDTPPVTDGGVTTTTAPTGAETTTATTAPFATTDGGIVAPTTPGTTAPAPSKTVPPKPTAPSKTEPTQTTTPTVPRKVVITGDEPDDELLNNASLRKKEKYLSRSLKKVMALHEGEDVKYAVIVAIPPMQEDWSDDFWNSNEEWAQLFKEVDEAHDAWYEEAKQVNPSWDGRSSKDIEIWTDTMRANYERYLTLRDMRDMVKEQHQVSYLKSVLKQRFEILKTYCDEEPIDVECGLAPAGYEIHGYYAELTAEQINGLAEEGGYTFRLASGEDRDALIDA